MLMSVVDNIMVGRLSHSADAIGATSLGSAFFYVFAIFGIGLMSGLDALVSHAWGAQDLAEGRRALAASLTLSLCATPVIAACIFSTAPLLNILGVAPEIRAEAFDFTRILTLSLPLLLAYTCFRRYLQGIHYVRAIPFALVTSNLVNLFGNWLLIYGNWHVPALGVRGSALSTVIARVYLAGVLGFAVYRRDPAAFRHLRPDPRLLRRLFRLGLPAALTIGFEVGVFHTVTALIATLDPVSLAAHTIALNAASVTYMVALGIASAAAVSVGRCLGANDRSGAARAGWIALGLTAVYEMGAALLFFLLPRSIARIYTQDTRVITLSVTLFAIAAVFQLFDGLQTVATGRFAGQGTRAPLWSGTWLVTGRSACRWGAGSASFCIRGRLASGTVSALP